jgi:hypothetical protein
MSNQRYPKKFKIPSGTQVTEKQLPVFGDGCAIGGFLHSPYAGLNTKPGPKSRASRRTVKVLSFAVYVLS